MNVGAIYTQTFIHFTWAQANIFILIAMATSHSWQWQLGLDFWAELSENKTQIINSWLTTFKFGSEENFNLPLTILDHIRLRDLQTAVQ